MLNRQIVEAKDCAPLEGVRVDVWQTDGLGVYSSYARQETGSTEGETFCSYVERNSPGLMERRASLRSIPVGIRAARHIFTKALVDEHNLITGQLYFPDPITEHVYGTISPYRERRAARDTYNANDFIFKRQGGADTIVNITQEGGSYLGSLVIGVER